MKEDEKKTPKLFNTWSGMMQRCYNKSYYHKAYSGRGITVQSDWHNFDQFCKWAKSSGYIEGLTIDRIDNDGNYEPNNCRWVTKSENSIKQRRLHQCKYKHQCQTLQSCTGRVGGCREYQRLASYRYRKQR